MTTQDRDLFGYPIEPPKRRRSKPVAPALGAPAIPAPIWYPVYVPWKSLGAHFLAWVCFLAWHVYNYRIPEIRGVSIGDLPRDLYGAVVGVLLFITLIVFVFSAWRCESFYRSRDSEHTPTWRVLSPLLPRIVRAIAIVAVVVIVCAQSFAAPYAWRDGRSLAHATIAKFGDAPAGEGSQSELAVSSPAKTPTRKADSAVANQLLVTGSIPTKVRRSTRHKRYKAEYPLDGLFEHIAECFKRMRAVFEEQPAGRSKHGGRYWD